MKKETLRLFKGYLGEKTNNINEKALKYGLLIPDSANDEIVDIAIDMYGKDGKKWNQTFHKDFEIVKNAPIEDLIAQQMIHYITTYGFESLGMYDNDLVYIPRESLDIPELDLENIEFIDDYVSFIKNYDGDGLLITGSLYFISEVKSNTEF